MKSRLSLLLLLMMMHSGTRAQDPEFPRKEFLLQACLHNGLVSDFHAAPDLYLGGIQLRPQVTVVEHLLRTGFVSDLFYTGKRWQTAWGPLVCIKLKTLGLKEFGSAGNLNLCLNHLWGSRHQRLVGASLQAELLNLVQLGIGAQRDYYLNNWWLQGSFGFRINRIKQPPHP